MREMTKLTVYTPTYNRIESLSVLYGSLLAQTNKNFVWMIIDDGSTDNTAELVDEWIDSEQLQIKYHRKENGGVHTAREYAFKHIDTELLAGVDSDDYLTNDAIQSILEEWDMHSNEGLAGMYYPCCLPDGSRLTEPFPVAADKATYQESLYKYGIEKDKFTVVRSDLMKDLDETVIFPNEKLVGESYKWIQLPEVPFRFVDKCIKVVNYQINGYSRNIRKLWFDNLNGFRAVYGKTTEYCRYPIPKAKSCLKYIISSIYLRDARFIQHSPRPLMTALLTPFGLLGYLATRFKWRRYQS